MVRSELDHFLEVLQRTNLDHIVGWFRFEHHLFTGEGIDSLARQSARLVNLVDLHESGDGERTRSASPEIFLDHGRHLVKHTCDLFSRESGVIGNVAEDLALGAGLDLSGSCGFAFLGGGFLFFLSHLVNPFEDVAGRNALSARECTRPVHARQAFDTEKIGIS